MNFTSLLLSWYKNHRRDLPWRHTSDPYKIWLSEIILQQTRIAQGIHYYQRFVDQYPDVYSLARASEDEVLALWQGLGYYSRARNLHSTAKIIVKDYNGRFPSDYKELMKLKGIGSYTAAAIASIAFNKDEAAIDGNIVRVLARYFGIDQPVDESAVRKNLERIAYEMLPPGRAGDYNQALMDFGSLVCKPKGPLCDECPFSQECAARLSGKIESIPVKGKKIIQKQRFFHFFLLYCLQGEVPILFIEKRKHNDIWKNLYQLPLVETPTKSIDIREITSHPALSNLSSGKDDIIWDEIPFHASHQLTHQRIEAFFYKKRLKHEDCSIFEKYYTRVCLDDFRRMGKPVLITRFLDRIDKST